jgi:methyltransferase family protein
MRTSFLLKLSIVALMCWRTMPAMTQERHKEHTPTEMNKQFQDPKLDVQKFVQRFESESRDIFAQRRPIVEAVGLRSGMAVADIGAGTGLFTWLFTKKVGTTGTVYAVEIAPAFLKYLEEESRKRGLDKVVKTVQSSQTRTNLAGGSSTWPSSVPLTTISSIQRRYCARFTRRFAPGGNSSSSTSICVMTVVRLCANVHAPPKRYTSGKSRPRASGISKPSTRSTSRTTSLPSSSVASQEPIAGPKVVDWAETRQFPANDGWRRLGVVF